MDQIIEELRTIRDYVRWCAASFRRNNVYFGHGTDNALDESIRLVFHCAGLSLGSEDVFMDAALTKTERVSVLEMLRKRIEERTPLPYLTGVAWFSGLEFSVDERVLVPRSPFAELIEGGFSPWLRSESLTSVLDLCTGCGCIGIATAHYFEEAAVDLVDVSPEALLVAQENIARYELEHRVKTIESDLFSALEGKQYQLIVSNPPYVDKEDLLSMPSEYQHEPALALGSGDDGLDLTRKILRESPRYLADEGVLIVEVGNSCIALEKAYPNVAFTWLEFERGGHGVFVFTREELLHYASYF